MYDNKTMPPLLLSTNSKGKKWRKSMIDWGDSKSFFNYSLVRKSVVHKKINYDLLNGKLHMQDLEYIINPDSIKAGFVPDRLLHYPIINSKLNLLLGEERKRPFDFRVVVTNPNAVSEIETAKQLELLLRLLYWVQNTSLSEEEANLELTKINDYFTYEWQDTREIRANCLLNHYSKEYNIPKIFNEGFRDAMAVGEEIYLCDIVGGEPVVERLNPLKVRIYRSGYSNKIEDADMIIIEDYWSPAKIIDTYYDVLTPKDRAYIEKMPDNLGLSPVDSMGNIDERMGFVNNYMIGDEITSQDSFFFDPFGTSEGIGNSLLPYDMAGNVRVMRMYWKSRRKIKKVKSYDPETGEEVFNFYNEDYILNESMGEEELIYYINEAWEGTKIGLDIYVNMRPRPILYNRLSNPSRCHFGIIGSIYNLNDSRPYSLVDMMKPYNYLYDVIHDRLNKILARNWGNLVRFDFSKKPKGWDIDKWMYYAKTMGIMVEDSFNEGLSGLALGKLAGGLNTNSNGVIAAADVNTILLYTNLLEYIKNEMAEVSGISKQREGLVSNRETVGGVERSTLLSSHITEWLFSIHDDVKKRVAECLLETAKIAYLGRNIKFLYILSDGSLKSMEIDGDEFAECDYGLVVDNSNGIQELNSKLDTLALAALLNQTLSFSTIMKLYSSASLAEKLRFIEKDEREILERNAQALLLLMLVLQLLIELLALTALALMELQYKMNLENNETKILVAEINSLAEAERFAMMSGDDSSNLLLEENKRLFDAKLKLEKEKLEELKRKNNKDAELKLKLINKPNKTSK